MRDDENTWNLWHWFGWVLGVGTTFLASLVCSFFVLFGDSSTCNNAATNDDRGHGLQHLALCALVLSVGWVVAGLASRRWGRMIGGAMIGLLPIAYTAVTHLQVTDWSGGFCF